MSNKSVFLRCSQFQSNVLSTPCPTEVRALTKSAFWSCYKCSSLEQNVQDQEVTKERERKHRLYSYFDCTFLSILDKHCLCCIDMSRTCAHFFVSFNELFPVKAKIAKVILNPQISACACTHTHLCVHIKA